MNVREIRKSMGNSISIHHKVEKKLLSFIKEIYGVEPNGVIPTPFGILPSMVISILLSRKTEYKDIPVSYIIKPLRFSQNYENDWETELVSGVMDTLDIWGVEVSEEEEELWMEWALRPLTQDRLDAQSSYLSKRDIETSDTEVEEIGEETNFLSGLSD